VCFPCKSLLPLSSSNCVKLCCLLAFAMPSLARPSTTQSSPLKSSSTKPAMSPVLTRSRSRKVQPGLKQRAEAFLAQAAADTDSTPKEDVTSRKRKRGSVDAEKKQSQALALDAQSTTSKQVRKIVAVPRARPVQVQERPHASEDLVPRPLMDDDDVGPLMSRTQTKKALKSKAATEANEPVEKRLKVFRKQAPKTFHEKLHRATSQRYVPRALFSWLNADR